nr:DUF1064 domain-containing protein [uncultured Rhodoferax sp.]
MKEATKPVLNKFGAKKTVVDGIKFDSKAEARRWCTLKLWERAGEISDLMRQVVYPLLPGVKFTGDAKAKPALRYVADFVYKNKDGAVVVEDCKGMVTEGARIKRHMMLALKGIEVRFVK